MKPVAEVLQENADSIIAGWLVLIRDAGGPLFAKRPLDELFRSTRRAFDAVVELLATGDDTLLHRHINSAVHERSVQGFQLAEVQRAFLGLREVIWPLVDQTYLDRESCLQAVKALDMAMTHATLEYSQAYEAQVTQRLQQLAITDSLTGLYNRRYLDLILRNELRRLERFHEPLSALFLDLDFFKNYNDSQGHLCGDQALQLVARILRRHVRAGDVVARYGGEEFVVILPQTPLSAAVAVAERLRTEIAAQEFPGEPKPQRLTISIGVICTCQRVAPHQFLRRVDEAAYRAKREGRNRVVIGQSWLAPQAG